MGAVVGAATVLFFKQGADPKSIAGVFRLKNGVVVLVKKWWPEIARLDGERDAWFAEVRLNCKATSGRIDRRSGKVLAIQVAL